MAIFYLIRHCLPDAPPDLLCGRTPGFHLSDEGRAQARMLADRFRNIPIVAMYSSPIERAVETAEPLAAILRLPIQISEEISEIDFGQWTGRTLPELEKDPGWRLYNTFRAGASAPGGETFLQLQNRMAHWIERIRREHHHGHIAAVSHCDPIRAAVTYYASIHLNAYSTFEIDRASVTAMRIDDHGSALLTLNNSGALPQ